MSDLDLAFGAQKLKGTAATGAGDALVSQYLGKYGALALKGQLYAAYTTAVALSLPATATIVFLAK